MIARSNGIIPLTPAADHSGKEGYAILASGAICSAATDIPLGVIVEGSPTTGKDAVALCDGGLAGTVKVKLNATPGTVALGTYLQLCADGTAKADAGSGARVIFARALESGSAGELIEAVLITPVSYSAE